MLKGQAPLFRMCYALNARHTPKIHPARVYGLRPRLPQFMRLRKTHFQCASLVNSHCYAY